MSFPPYVGWSNSTLQNLAPAKTGDLVVCSCGQKHPLMAPDNYVPSATPPILHFYKCGEDLFIGAVGGRLTAGVRPDAASGRGDDE